MKINKKVFFNIHSWIGIRLSILFFIVCFSGTLATLSHEMDWLFNPASRATPSEKVAGRNVIVQNFSKTYPTAQIEYWMRPDEPYMADILYKLEDGQRSYVFANRYTGEIQGESQVTIQRFFRDLHYYLFIPFQIGHFMVLAFAFLLLISLITALLFYKKWWKKLFVLQTGKGLLVFFRSLHRLVGLWSVPFSILFSLTGIWYFIERANISGIGEEVNPRPPIINRQSGEGALPAERYSTTLDYDRAVRLAEAQIPGLQVGDLLPAKSADTPIYLTGTSDVPLVRQRANRVYVDPQTYEVIKVQQANEIGTKMWLNDIMDPLHFGSWGGLVTKIIWFVFGLGISSLILSGIWITLKRRAMQRRQKKAKIMGFWKYVNWAFCAAMLGYMYYIIFTRYQASVLATAIISLGWAGLALLAYYIFVYRLRRNILREQT